MEILQIIQRLIIWIQFYALLGLCCDHAQYTGWADMQIQFLGSSYPIPCSVLTGGDLPQAGNEIKVFVFQKDEVELLSDWLQYHAYLFGLHNIHIIDHLSTNPQICKLLALYHVCGANITVHDGPFFMKQRTLTSVMRDAGSNKFLVPLDADEFIALPVQRISRGYIEDFLYEPTAIQDAFSRLPIDGRKYKFGGVFPVKYEHQHCVQTLHDPSNHTRRVLSGGIIDRAQYEAHRTKTFFYSEGFIATDQGNHYGAVLHDKGRTNADPEVLANVTHYYAVSELALLHLSVSSYETMKAKMLRGADAYHYTDTSNCSTAGAGKHYCIAAKMFRHDSAQGRELYLHECVHRHSHDQSQSQPAVPLDSLRGWFVKHTLSLSQLVGDDF